MKLLEGWLQNIPESMALTASKLMIQRLKDLLDTEKSFAFETTASGTNYVRHLKSAKAKGYEVSLTFLWLAKPEESVIRRYYLGIKNLLTHYLPLVDEALIMDNSSEKSSKRLIARKNKNKPLDVIDRDIWKKIQEIANEQ